jgi:hypothetical protein
MIWQGSAYRKSLFSMHIRNSTSWMR